MQCITQAWSQHESELRGWARHRLGNAADADDLLQDIFMKALRQGDKFCAVLNARAWLFEVARNTFADRMRVAKHTVELPDDLVIASEEADTVNTLTGCIPRVLSELSTDDRDAISMCDLQGISQADFALAKGLTLSAAKSRLQRARTRMKQRMTVACQVKMDAGGHVIDFVPRARE